jgi:hypothetical protein
MEKLIIGTAKLIYIKEDFYYSLYLIKYLSLKKFFKFISKYSIQN